jgi:hypothetical protein
MRECSFPSPPPPSPFYRRCRRMGATELRVLRVMVSSVFDMAAVVARTMREFA